MNLKRHSYTIQTCGSRKFRGQLSEFSRIEKIKDFPYRKVGKVKAYRVIWKQFDSYEHVISEKELYTIILKLRSMLIILFYSMFMIDISSYYFIYLY